MGTTIDKNIVQMIFDNAGFEDGVSETMSMIDKLKSSFDFSKAEKSFDGLTSAANNIDLSGISSALDNISSRFSTWGIIASTTIAKITNEALNGLGSIAKKITNMAISGGISRAMNIEKAKFQLQGLGIVWDDIKDDIDYGVKDTAYGLDAAANVASQLVASGVQLGDDMKASLRGISGVAAMTNSTYEEIGSIFTTVAGQGQLMTMQLRQLETRGLNAAAQLGEQLGKSEAEIREMVHKGQIDFATFSKAMNDAFGEHAKEANRTFTGVISNIRSALSRIGAEFIQPLIENDGPIVQLLEAVRVMINNIKSEIVPLANYFTSNVIEMAKVVQKFVESINVEGMFDKVTYAFGGFVRILKALAPSVQKVGKMVKSAFNTVFPKKDIKEFRKQVDDVVNAVKKFKIKPNTLRQIQNIALGIFNAMKLGIKVIKNLVKASKPLIGVIKSIASFGLKTASTIGQIITVIAGGTAAFEDFEEVASRVSEAVKKAIGRIKDSIDWGFELIANNKIAFGLAELIGGTLVDSIYGLIDVFEALTGMDLSGFKESLGSIFTGISESFTDFVASISEGGNVFESIVDFIWDILRSLGSKIVKKFEEITGIDLSSLKETFKKVSDSVKEDLDKMVEAFDPIDSIKKKVDDLSDSLSNLKGIMKKLLDSAVEGLSQLISNPFMTISMLTGSNFLNNISMAIKNAGNFGGLTTTLQNLSLALKNFTYTIQPWRIAETALSIISFAVAIGILADAVDTVSSAAGGNMTGTLLAIGGVIAMVLILAGSLRTLTGLKANNLIRMSFAMLIIAEGVKVLSKSIAEIGEVYKAEGDNITLGLLSVVAMSLLLVAITMAINQILIGLQTTYKNLFKVLIFAVVMNVIAEAISVLASSLVEVAEILEGDAWLTKLLPAGVAIVAFIFALAAAVRYMSSFGEAQGNKVAKDLIRMGIALIPIALAVKVLTSSLKDMVEIIATYSWDKIIGGFGLTMLLLFSLASIVSSFNTKHKILLRTAITILATAVAMKILVNCIKDLTEIPFETMLEAVVGFIVIWGIFCGVLESMKQRSADAALLLLGAAAAVYILASAIKMVTNLPTKEMALATSILIILLYTVTKLADKASDNLEAAATMIIFAGSLYIIAKACEMIAKLDPAKLVLNLLSISGALALFTLVAWLIEKKVKKESILTILGLAVAFGIFAYSVQMLNGIDWKSTLIGIGLVVAALVVMIGAITVLSKLVMMPGFVEGAAILMVMGIALLAFATSLKALSYIPWKNVGSGLTILAGALIILGVAAAIFGGAWEIFLAGAGVIAALGIAVGIAVAAISGGLILLGFAAQQMALAFSVTIQSLGEVNSLVSDDKLVAYQKFFTVLKDLAKVAVLLGAATFVLGVGLVVTGAGLILCGAGALLLAGAIAFLTASFLALNKVFPISELLFGKVGDATEKTSEEIQNAAEQNKSAAKSMSETDRIEKQNMMNNEIAYRKSVKESVLLDEQRALEVKELRNQEAQDHAVATDSMIQNNNMLAGSFQGLDFTSQQSMQDMVNNMTATSQNGSMAYGTMSNNAQLSMGNMDSYISNYSLDAANNFGSNTNSMMGSMDALTSNMDINTDQIVGSLMSMDNKTGVSLQSTGSKFETFMNTIGFERLNSNMNTKGSNLGTNFVNGLLKALDKGKANISTAGSNLAASAQNGFALRARIHSPSKVGEWLGSMFDMGVVLGIDKDADQVANSTENLAAQAEGALLTSMSLIHDKLLGDMSEPVITPVIDMSNIQNGADRLNTMFGQKYASTISASYKTNREYSDEAAAANYANMAAIGSQLTGAINANNVGNLPVNVSVYLEGDADGVFNLVRTVNDRSIKALGASPLRAY